MYPKSLVLQYQKDLGDWYSRVLKDTFFSPQRPAWFPVYTFLEFVIHVPVSIWSIKALLRGESSPKSSRGCGNCKCSDGVGGGGVDDPWVPLILLPYAVEMSVTSVTCTAEMLSWPLARDEMVAVGIGYVLYDLLGKTNVMWAINPSRVRS